MKKKKPEDSQEQKERRKRRFRNAKIVPIQQLKKYSLIKKSNKILLHGLVGTPNPIYFLSLKPRACISMLHQTVLLNSSTHYFSFVIARICIQTRITGFRVDPEYLVRASVSF